MLVSMPLNPGSIARLAEARGLAASPIPNPEKGRGGLGMRSAGGGWEGEGGEGGGECCAGSE